MIRCTWVAVAVLICMPAGAAEETPSQPSRLALAGPKPRPVKMPSAEEIDGSIRRGVGFLLGRQNKDGSWGSARRTKGLNIDAPVPGAHHAFRSAVTALCISALIEVGGDDPRVTAAIDRGEACIFEHLPTVRRATPEVFYNTWSHAYAIEALVRMLQRQPDDGPRCERIHRLIEQQIEMLGRYECVDGGWAYYDSAYRTQKPGDSTICFVTATVLVAFDEARQVGIEVPERLVKRGTASILRQRKADFSYCYGEYLKMRPMRGINRPAGSLGRSQACSLAMRLWGDPLVTDAVLTTWLDRLFARNGWLDIGRKRPIPHESWFQVAGYFFYYGHYYAAKCIEQIEPSQRGPYQGQLARILLDLQEKDGCWWDYPLYDYHQQYGTAFALMTLGRCRPAQR
ncbi:MAG: hypothetical protein A2V70_03055 [Planctomycetes bacterium RBG_13_63_9]|nr:MAG: hypothetical protein A2V70_03055 [Planctomycetes bacterium RBG_13_63_9]